MKIDFRNYFTTCDDRYPNNRQGTLVLLDKYNNYSLIQQTTLERISLYQGGEAVNTHPPYDKNIGKYAMLQMLTKSSLGITFHKKNEE